MGLVRSAALVVPVAAFAAACVGADPAPGSSLEDAGAPDGRAEGGVDPLPDAAADAGGDANAVADADADAGSWTPIELPGIALWLDASFGATYDGNLRLETWADRSGQANNASKGTCVGPAKAAASLNGLDTLVFDGATTCLAVADAATLRFGTGDFAIFTVARYANANSGPATLGTFFAKRDTAAPLAGVILWGNTSLGTVPKLHTRISNLAGNGVDSVTSGLNDGAFRVYGALRRANVVELRINASNEGSTNATAVDVSATGRALLLGADPDFGMPNYLSGAIAEAVAVKGTVTDADAARLVTYLRGKYGL